MRARCQVRWTVGGTNGPAGYVTRRWVWSAARPCGPALGFLTLKQIGSSTKNESSVQSGQGECRIADVCCMFFTIDVICAFH